MPSIAGLQRLLALWKRYSRGESKPSEAKEWWSLFGYLADVRTWSAKDRVDARLAAYVDRMLERYPARNVRIELDLWFRENEDLRLAAREYVMALVQSVGGELLDFVTIPEIRYQAALIDVPGAQARALRGLSGPIASADQVMRVRPQSLYVSDDPEPTVEAFSEQRLARAPDTRPPIVALLDGYPIQNHELLANRLDIVEVDVTAEMSPVSRRFHGTAMASLILHGDLGNNEPALDRTLKVVPILAAPQGLNEECTPLERLPVGMVYRAVRALAEGLNDSPPAGDRVVIVNHSICDVEAQFARRPGPWAKLLDYLSHRYRVLFIVSAGNSTGSFDIDTYSSCSEFEGADPVERQIVLLRAIEQAKGTRAILSPAEALNVVTVGAVHADSSSGCPAGHVDPFLPVGVTNLGSSVGLGINRAIKPEIVEAGGRQMAMSEEASGSLSVWPHQHGGIGQLAASPDIMGGTTAKVARSTGTSNAAALATRAAVKIASSLEAVFERDGADWLSSPTRAVLVKALLVHSSSWGDAGALLHELHSGSPQRRRETISRYLGYGRINHDRIMFAHGSRITLLADDVISPEHLHGYSIPIPRAMVGNRELRRVVMTLAWSTPIEPLSTRYRGVFLELVDRNGKRAFWKGVKPILQPAAFAGRRGTVQHLALEGSQMIRSAEEGSFFLGVQARADLAAFASSQVPYALAVTLELAQPVRQDLFADIQARVRLKAPAARPLTPVRIRTRT